MVVDLQVDRLVTGGDGIAELDGLKVFVPFAAPQERVRARVVVRKRDYAVASIEAILEPSPLRVNPPCRYYGACGGCQIQHIDYAGQLIAKKLMVNDALQHVGRIFLPVRNLAGDGAPFHYRNKTQYPVTRNGDLRIGFFRRGTHSVIDVAECLLHPPAFDRLRAVAAEAIGRWEAPYQERQHAGNVRHLVVREGEEGLQVLLATREASVRPELAEAIASHPGVAGVVQSLNPARTNRILGPRFNRLAGSDYLTQIVLDHRFRVSAGSFFQVNRARAEELCRKVLRFVAPIGTETVLDLYSGVGMLSILMAGFCRRVIGVELDTGATADARTNAELAGLANVEFRCGDVERLVPSLPAPDVVVLDPPRRGAGPAVLRSIADLGPSRIVYVSCNPATLARDLALLERLSYTTDDVQPVDMFPQTAHVEVVACLSRAGSG